jgi:pyruvate,water dikinase
MSESTYLKWLDETDINEVDVVGGKNASLGEMIKNLKHLNIKVPYGFVVTANSYDLFMAHNNLVEKIQVIIDETDIDDFVDLKRNSLKIRNLIVDGEIPDTLKIDIIKYYKALSHKYLDNHNQPQEYTDVAVRSSGTSEDLPDASFAGQQDTYLNVRGNTQLLERIKSCFASLYTDRAICYRKTMGYLQNVKLSVCVQKMVRSDLGCSGVAFSIDPDSGFKDVVVVNGSWGLGEMVVSGQVKPDEFIIHKKTLDLGYKAIIDKTLGDKINKMVYADEHDKRTKIVQVEKFKQHRFCLDDIRILQLASWTQSIEAHYSNKYNRWCPVDVEWALDGLTNELYIVQARPETIHSKKPVAGAGNEYVEYSLDMDTDTDTTRSGSEVLLTGVAVGSTIGSGAVKLIFNLDTRDCEEFKEGDVLVTEYTDPTYEPLMKKASAIITDKGGRTSHAAIVSRELGKTAIVGCGNATKVLKMNQNVTACCSDGDIGKVYDGLISYTTKRTNLENIPKLERIKTKLMLNIGNPSNVFKFHNLPVAGVGLAREEFIIANTIGIHPLAILHPDKTTDDIKSYIESKSRGFNNPREFYVKRLAYGISRIGATFHPNPVIVRFSDFKSNEYRDLVGGSIFEPNEENPMLGFRGCSRYYSDFFKAAFQLECEAIRYVREIIGLSNVIVMLPFCRTVEECKKTIDIMREFGLERGINGLKIYLMCEIPSNVILADEFCKLVDGFSIGSNDLTQLCLGIDRDAGNLTFIGNETNQAVKILISNAIKSCNANGVKIGICGQGPSDIPEFAEFLVKEGIDTISLVPDSIVKTVFNLDKLCL